MRPERLSPILLAWLFVSILALAPIDASAQKLRTVDFPGASSTYLTAINSQGDVAGYYSPGSHGFYTRNHKLHSVEVSYGQGTFPWGIDDRYDVVGWFGWGRGERSGFGHGPNGFRHVYSAFGSDYCHAYNITATTGIVSGYCGSDVFAGGFYYSDGQYYAIIHPGNCVTVVTGENDQGQFVGYCQAGLSANGFLYDGVSMFTDIVYPGATFTFPNRISNSGEIVGSYQLGDQVNHGFTYVNGTFTTVDFPGAKDTQIFGVNASGVIVGDYTDLGGVVHGFIGTP